jgi:hypothetical protein
LTDGESSHGTALAKRYQHVFDTMSLMVMSIQA